MNTRIWLKLTEKQANQMISLGISQMFGGVPTKFKTYKSYVEDKETGDKYWKVKNLTYKNNKDELFEYKIIEWVTENYPQLIQYSDEYVQQYRTVMDII